MVDLREKAIHLITGQAQIKQVVRRCRMACLAAALACFGVGFAVGASMPFVLTAVPIKPDLEAQKD